jgi:Fic family protein
MKHRAGIYVRQAAGYRAFIPASLPPIPAIDYDVELSRQLSDADRALGRLDGVASVLPNPELFVAMYVRHEAVLSSQIEGTQSTLEDVLEYEIHALRTSQPRDVEEVVNYVAAMNHGLRRLADLPLSLRMLREIHAKLLTGVRGQERQPGAFRTSQNWIGPSGCTLENAEFIPPPPHEMQLALSNFESFLHDRQQLPLLIQCGLAHAQFETIHPFLDGNGRMGRLLVTLLLCERKVLQQPLLYLSYFLKEHRAQYYDRLMAVRNEGAWESWLKFFLRGVHEVAQSATDTARAILDLRETHRRVLMGETAGGGNATLLLDELFKRPLVSIRDAQAVMGCSYVTAAKVVERLEGLGIVTEATGQRRNRIYRYSPYLDLFDRQRSGTPARKWRMRRRRRRANHRVRKRAEPD